MFDDKKLMNESVKRRMNMIVNQMKPLNEQKKTKIIQNPVQNKNFKTTTKIVGNYIGNSNDFLKKIFK